MMRKIVESLRALGEENRIRIIYMLCQEEMCVCELIEQLKLSQSAVSHHLKTLKQAGLINDRRRGKWILYSLNKEAFAALSGEVQGKIWEPVKNSNWLHKDDPHLYCVKKSSPYQRNLSAKNSGEG